MAMSLTSEDKQWIQETMSEAFEHFGQQVDHKLGVLELKLDQKLDHKLEALEHRMTEKLYGQETRLLTAFHSWGSPMETRLRSHSAALRALDVELETLKERVDRLERKQTS
jgi:hypothetical protein